MTGFRFAFKSGHNGKRSQINLADYNGGGQYPFLNFIKSGQTWSTVTGTLPWTPTSHDANGWPTSVYGGGVETSFFIPSQTARAGNYVVGWTGGDSSTSVSCNQDSIITGAMTGANGRCVFAITTTNPIFKILNPGGTPATSYYYCHINDETALLGGEVFGTQFKGVLADFGVIRFLADTLQARQTKWSDRTPISYYSYLSNQFPSQYMAPSQTAGTGTAYTLSFPGFVLADKARIICQFHTNQTGSATLSINGGASIPLFDPAGFRDLASGSPTGYGSIIANLWSDCVYDLGLNVWMVKNGVPPGASSVAHFGIDGMLPPELAVQLCNEVGAHLWTPAPFTSCDPLSDWFTQYCSYYASHANAGLKLFLEGPNECWNSAYPGTLYSRVKEMLLNGGFDFDTDNWYGMTMSRIGQAARAVLDKSKCAVVCSYSAFGGTGINNTTRLESPVYVAAGGSAAKNWVTHVGAATYYNGGIYGKPTEVSLAYEYQTALTARAAAILLQCVNSELTDDATNAVFALPNLRRVFGQMQAMAATYGLNVAPYEGGPSWDYTGDYGLPQLVITAITRGTTTTLTAGATDYDGVTRNPFDHMINVLGASGLTTSLGGISGTTQLNGNTYTVLSATSTTITINVNSSGFGVFTSSPGSFATVVGSGTYLNALRHDIKFHPLTRDHTVLNMGDFTSLGSNCESPSNLALAGPSSDFTMYDPDIYIATPPRILGVKDYG